ncbi:MAG: hypothetical protein HC805_04235 [Alkalinema sp. RL_2_19]|nr:hypothetical protein [Alkalinema sp. RL_2_19]
MRQLILIGFCIFGLVVGNQATVEEWLNLPPRPTSNAVEQLARATTMTRSAQRLFYRQDPSIEPKEAVLDRCRIADKGIILGCYIRRGSWSKIAIQRVTDPRLKGTMEVTAAHEMLHAAYEQLRLSERGEIQIDLAITAKNIEREPQYANLSKLLNQYRRNNPSVYDTELHSHIGTEVANLSPTLERYYQRYFTDRQRIVKLSKQSIAIKGKLEQESNQLRPEIEQLETELKQLDQQLSQAEARLQETHARLNAQAVDLQQTKQAAELAFLQRLPQANQRRSEFEQRKAQFNDQVDQHNENARIQKERIADFNAKVAIYKQKIQRYNAVAKESRDILDSLTIRSP